MLDTEDVDDDFFTPVAGTSLANIFGNISKNTEATTNDTLKYVPPKPQNISVKSKQEHTKSTECIFACVLLCHEWTNNVYTIRGKLGFAIVKIQKTGDHNIVLYDSNKTTLSCTTISTSLEVTIKNGTYLSYYDNFKKYWSIYGTEEEIKKVADNLAKLEVNIKYSTYIDQGPPEPTNEDINTNTTLKQNEKNNIESDTDSSINRKTKASILNRMANMGHSVLPTRSLPTERTSDSSDTMEVETQAKTTRHKPGKSVFKRNNLENMMPETQHLTEPQQRIVMPKTESVEKFPVYASLGGQLLPMTSTSLITGSNNDFGLFISEQRISNSELRMNMNRITDKVDLVLNKMNNIEYTGNTSVLMKLLSEYENKIKVYEELLKSSTGKEKFINIGSLQLDNDNSDLEILKKKIFELEKLNQEKTNEIINFQNEITLMKTKHTEETLNQRNKETELLKQINSLEHDLKAKDEEIENLTKKCETLSSDTNTGSDNISDKVKNIMNNAFQTISINFEDEEDYSGETVKKIIATVIKKITIETLNDL